MVDIVHRIGIKVPISQVFNAICSIDGLAHWWTEEVHGDESIGGRIEFTFRSVNGDVKGKMVMVVEEYQSPVLLRWRCVDGPAEWIGTTISFELSQQSEQTIILFGHRNWREANEMTSHCSMKWAVFLLSLREYLETGKGKPSPNDLKIDNWN